MAALEWLQLGGVAMWILALMSVVAVTLVIIKFWEYSEWRLTEGAYVELAVDAWEHGDTETARAELERSGALLATVMGRAIEYLSQCGLSASQARERIERLGNETLEVGRRHLRTLELIGSLAPLIGLLGTVVGMIDAFQALQAAGDRIDPAILSAGIWKALLTTAAGLVVAIPVIAVAHYLEQRMVGFQVAMESALTRLLTRPVKECESPA